MVRLAELWDRHRRMDDSDPRRIEIEREINRVEQWMIDRGYKEDGITRFHHNAPNPDYPARSGCIRLEDAQCGRDGLRVILLSCEQSAGGVTLKAYSPFSGKIILIPREYERSVYVTPQAFAEIPDISGCSETVYDVMRREDRHMVRIPASAHAEAAWNGDMRASHAYAYENGLSFGAWYVLGADGSLRPADNDAPVPDIPEAAGNIRSQAQKWSALLSQEMPDIRRVAFDIEVEVTGDALPDPLSAPGRVTAISFHSDDLKRVLMLRRPECARGEDGDGYELQWYDDEKAMLEDAFSIIQNYPVVLTYNGDAFDMPYLYNRAVALGIGYVPFRMMARNATLEAGIHIDMYGVFSNRSLKIYAFGNSYVRNGLGDVSEALLKESKTEYEGSLSEIPLGLLGKYCYNDSRLTYGLTGYDGGIVMDMLVTLIRVSNLPVDDVSRRAISAWAKSMIHAHHVGRGELVPNSSDFPDIAASTSAVVRDKKYHGAFVMEPVRGTHWDVSVLDFASLYPTILERYNISYDTVCCPCCKGKRPVPGTSHWICTRRTGTISLLIGSLKHLRVGHYKRLYRETGENRYRVIEQTLKVFLNASYGIIGADTFPLYFLPTAESVTAIGRNILSETAKKARDIGLEVLYGDTDSLFIKNPTQEQIGTMISHCREAHDVELEVDKEYRYLMLSGRKKNYFGVRRDGSPDIKGLSGKKSNTPPFLRSLFDAITGILCDCTLPSELDDAGGLVSDLIRARIGDIRAIPIADLALSVRITRDPSEYRVKPQAVRAAEQLGRPEKGQFVSFVKTWRRQGVMPVQTASAADIDWESYVSLAASTLEQITEPLGIDIAAAMGRRRQTSIDMW